MKARTQLGAACLCGLLWACGATSAADKIGILQAGAQPGHYLAWRGQPILLIGDSVTQGWMECGTNFHQTAYVDALAARGINLLMLWAFKGASSELQRNDKRIGYDAPELWPWAGSPDDRSFDLRRFNPAYFERLRQLVAYAERKGIVVLITVHDGWPKTCFAGHPFNRALGNGPLTDRGQYVVLADDDRELPATFDPAWDWQRQNQYFQERFCAKLIAELEPFSNVLYEMFNEGEWYNREQRLQHERHFLAFFRARCANVLLSNSDHIAGAAPHQEKNLDGVTLHPRDWVGHFPKFAAGFNTAPPKPYLYSEPVPEFDGETPTLEVVRRSVWETALAGAGWVNQNDPSFGWDTRAAIANKAAARDVAYDYAGHCARFFNRSGVRFWKMAPAPKLASTDLCLAQAGEEYVVYAPAGGRFTVDLSAGAAKEFEVRWYNPRTGKFQAAPAVAGGNAGETFTPPFAGDAVLHLRKVSIPPAESPPPYPPSPAIKRLEWAPTNTIVRRAKGSDNFPLTWADDDALYTTYGDGFGFEPFVPAKLSLGLARIVGTPEDFHGTNLRSPTLEQFGDGRKGQKGWGLLSVDGVLYLWMGHADRNGGQAQLAWSRDHGNSWTHADWRFAEFGLIGFVNFGRDYGGARDEYVYAYSHDGPLADTPADRFVLMRAPKDRLALREAWQFFVRRDDRGQPVWSDDIHRRGAVFEHRDACLRSAIAYNGPLKRYLWWQAIPQPPGHKDRGDTRFDGGFGVYDAPEPWGPWTTVYFTRQWDTGPGEHGDFPSKWVSADGRTLHLVFSGDDHFSIRRVTVILEE